MRKKILFGLVLFLQVSFMGYSQTYFANDDNFFVKPNSTTAATLDILLNDFYGGEQGCTLNDLDLTFPSGVQPPVLGYYRTSKGRFRIETATKRLLYQPNTDEFGTDIFIYQYECNASGTPVQKQATVRIHINDKPDAISEANCYIDPEAMTWGIKEIVRSDTLTDRVSYVSNILTGDIDGDGKTEIFVYNADHSGEFFPDVNSMRGASDRILVYEYNSITNELEKDYEIMLPDKQFIYPYGNFAIANVNNDEYGSVFVGYMGFTRSAPLLGESPSLLISYRYVPGSGGSKGSFVEAWRVPYITDAENAYKNVSPLIVDIMGDGNQQVCILNKVFDAKTGTLLADGSLSAIPVLLNGEFSYGRFGHSGFQYQSTLVAGDIDGDGIMELVGGDCVYKVNITNYAGTTGNSFERITVSDIRSTNINTGYPANLTHNYDGGTALVDLNNDGKLEVVVTAKSSGVIPRFGFTYVYDPLSGELLSDTVVIARAGIDGPSMPFIGDLDGDGNADIAISSYCTLEAYKYDSAAKKLNRMWRLPTTDKSSSTTLSIFDFDQSGNGKLIYRDETSLRIIDGREFGNDGLPIDSANRILAIFDGVYSATINEYPIVSDIDGDGYAEILTVANDEPRWQPDSLVNYWDFRGELRVYGPSTGHWAPARSVWNQTAYNPLYVNDDLTIPARPISPATAFYGDNGKIDRPFNNYLQQSTSLNREGTMIMLGPDLQFDTSVPKRLSFDGVGGVNVSLGIINRGDAPFSGPIYLALYAHAAGTYHLVGDYTYPNSSGLSNQTGSNTVSLNFNVLESDFPAGYDMLYITVNLSSTPDQNPVFKNGDECHGGYNNIGTGVSLINGSKVMCEGATESVQAFPANSYFLKWYDKNGILIKTATSKSDNSLTITKNSDVREFYLVEGYATLSSLNPVSSLKDSIFVYLTPESLTWTGDGNNGNWHDPENWSNPNSNDYPQANIPRGCTDVYIPEGLSCYPDLTSKSSSGNTDYTIYNQALCDSISFGHGGEVQHPDLLGYTKAAISATFNSHHWYAVAPPLKNFYTRDFHYTHIVPKFDDIYSYTRGWARRNPQNGYYEVNWTKAFNTPNTTFDAGQAFSLWIDDKSVPDYTDPLPHSPFSFNFPRTETEYWIYDIWMGNPVEGPFTAPRTNSHRFIFDGLPDGSGNFNLKVDNESPVAGDIVMMGNPFMSNLDFDEFYAANSSNIEPYYYVPDDNDSWTNYYNKNNAGASTINKFIAPMQAFMVRLKAGVNQLKANGNMTATNPGNKIRSSASANQKDDAYLSIEARQEEYISKVYIGFDDSYNDACDPSEDTPALFTSKDELLSGLNISTVSSDGMKLFINNCRLPQNGMLIPLSVRTATDKNLTFNLSNLPSVLSKGYKVEYYDALKNEYYDASLQSMKTFEDIQADAEKFIDNRFYIRISNNLVDIQENFDTSTDVRLWAKNNVLKINSDQKIDFIEVYDLLGRLLHRSDVKSIDATISLPYSNIYLVRLQIDNNISNHKVINR